MIRSLIRPELLRFAPRLPRDRDRDFIDLVFEQEMALSGVARLFGVSQPALTSHVRSIERRLELIRRHRQLHVGLRRRGRVDLAKASPRPTLRALVDEGYSKDDAQYLWHTYWTTSPTVARRLTGHGSRRTIARFLRTPVEAPELRKLQAGLGWLVRTKNIGCLWGRQGREGRPGTKGHRFVEGLAGTLTVS
jgi:hypothetical protein